MASHAESTILKEQDRSSSKLFAAFDHLSQTSSDQSSCCPDLPPQPPSSQAEAEPSANNPSAPNAQQPAVRFASVNQEIEPAHSLQAVRKITSDNAKLARELSPEAQQEIRNLAMTVQKSRLQESRMSNFAFEPVSLPPSRVGPLFIVHP